MIRENAREHIIKVEIHTRRWYVLDLVLYTARIRRANSEGAKDKRRYRLSCQTRNSRTSPASTACPLAQLAYLVSASQGELIGLEGMHAFMHAFTFSLRDRRVVVYIYAKIIAACMYIDCVVLSLVHAIALLCIYNVVYLVNVLLKVQGLFLLWISLYSYIIVILVMILHCIFTVSINNSA